MSDRASAGTDPGNTRIACWDNLKFAMITLMVIGHFADFFTDRSDICKSIFLFIYAFHMPMLLFVSGLFYKPDRCRQKVLYYISGGFALKFFAVIIGLITTHHASFSLLSDGGLPWFFFVLAIYQLLMLAFKNINKGYLLVFSILLACFTGYDQSIGDFLYLSRTIVFFPFFLLGTMLNREKTLCYIENRKNALIPAAAVVLAVWFWLSFFRLDTFYIYRYLFTGRNSFPDEIIGYGPAARLLCDGITFAAGAAIVILIPKKRIPFFTFLGSRTENVYFWHYGLYLLMAKYLHIADLFNLSLSGKACFFLIAIALSIVLSAVGLFNYPLCVIKRICFQNFSSARSES